MRKIPPHITDAGKISQLNQLQRQIDEKMNVVNRIRDKGKKGGFSDPDVQELKKLGTEIDGLDRQWKTLVGPASE